MRFAFRADCFLLRGLVLAVLPPLFQLEVNEFPHHPGLRQADCCQTSHPEEKGDKVELFFFFLLFDAIGKLSGALPAIWTCLTVSTLKLPSVREKPWFSVRGNPKLNVRTESVRVRRRAMTKSSAHRVKLQRGRKRSFRRTPSAEG